MSITLRPVPSDGRSTVLTSIRNALARSLPPSASAPTPPPLQTPGSPDAGAHTRPTAAAAADPIGTFIASARAVGTEVHTTASTTLDVALERIIDDAITDLARPAPARLERWPGGNESAPFVIDITIVQATLGITTLGSVLLEGPRLAPMTAEITIAILDAKTLVPTLHDALVTHRPGPTRLFVTGPSKTADIEGVLVTGVHGPRRFIVVLVT